MSFGSEAFAEEIVDACAELSNEKVEEDHRVESARLVPQPHVLHNYFAIGKKTVADCADALAGVFQFKGSFR